MQMRLIVKKTSAILMVLSGTLVLATSAVVPSALALGTADEIHYSYGENPGDVVFDWQGSESIIEYGLDASYGQQATAVNSAVTPVDMTGSFKEVKLTGLQPNTTYHYRIGGGPDYTFKTRPTGSFRWVDMGDTGSTLCSPWLADTQALVAAQQPDFVTHGGDISYANECGVGAVHRYYTDQEVWSHSTAFQPVWGNHEYGQPTADAPSGTPRDSMANYKGRSYITNAQIVPTDKTTQTANPGCGWETGATTNTCRGEDWGWFRAGNVLYISYPEPWTNALTDWQAKAGPLMAQAQADASIDFIVTYGHRPAYSSQTSNAASSSVLTALTALAQQYSPSSSNPNGKYVLNMAHHVHGAEVFSPIDGLVNITNGGGGEGQTSYGSTAANSIYKTVHPSIMAADYDATSHSLKVNVLCGPAYAPNPKEPCAYGSVLYSQTFTRPNTPANPVVHVTHTDGVTSVQNGTQITYATTVSSDAAGTTAAGASVQVTLPGNTQLVSADNGAVVNGATVSWALGDLPGGQQVIKHVTVAVQGTNGGDHVTSTAQVTTMDTSCTNQGSVCMTTDDDTVPLPVTQWISNQTIETDLTGWTGKYGASSYVTVARSTEAAHSGTASIKVAGITGAQNLSSGFNDSPRSVQSTVAGKMYTASIWVKPQAAGQVINLRLREWRGSTLVTDQKLALTAASTAWQQMTLPITAAENGNQLAFIVYGSGLDAGEYFYVDDLSFTSPN